MLSFQHDVDAAQWEFQERNPGIVLMQESKRDGS